MKISKNRFFLVLISLILASPSLLFAKAENIVWKGDFETGNLSQWPGKEIVSADRIVVIQSPVRQGKYAIKVTVKQGDDPIGASGNRNELYIDSYEPVNSEYYYSWSTMFDPGYPSANTWQVFTQFHHTGPNGSPPLEFDINGEKILLTRNGDITIWETALRRGVWIDFILHVKWSPDASVGFVEVWMDQKLVLPKKFLPTQYSGQLNSLKQGLYRNNTISADGIVYHDGMTRATTLADVWKTGDSIKPVVSITSPLPGTTVLGTITLVANATDNVGVTGVQFMADGKNTGTEDLSAPYSISFNTLTLSNATHNFSAIARDASGNTATSSAVTVTVKNGPHVLFGPQNNRQIMGSTRLAIFPDLYRTSPGIGVMLDRSYGENFLLRLTNMQGNIIKDFTIPGRQGTYKVSLGGSEFPSGVYYMILDNREIHSVKKVHLVK